MSFSQYLGFDILEIEPSWDDPSSNLTHNVTKLDSHTGKLRVWDRSGVSFAQSQKFRWVMGSRVDIQVWRDWQIARKGAAVPFWVPSWKFDIKLVQKFVATSTSMSISNIGYTRFMFPDKARHYIVLRLPGGVKFYRKIIASVEIDATRESLTLDSALPVDVNIGAGQINFLMLVRMAQDDPELMWHSNSVAEVTFDMVELPFEVPA
jgi:hypothetical protein